MLPYSQHPGKVVQKNSAFKHVMAITLDPKTTYTEGIVRCITSREGNLEVRGYVDRSKLFKLKGTSLEHFEITEELTIQNSKKILDGLIGDDGDFIGLEDPDIWRDSETGLMHVYFTIPIKSRSKKEKIKIHLGHASGNDLDSLVMTKPVLLANESLSAKEVSIAPINSQGFRYNLVESHDRQPEAVYSTVQVALAHDMGAQWEYGETAFHPAHHKIPWIGGHASPGPLLPESFINLGPGKRVGIMNGREADQKQPDGTITYGMFSVGLFIYDYEHGKIEWISPQPLIRDSEAVTITFASHFIETKPGEGILYAHVDDSFVRAYTLFAEGIKKILP